MLAFLKKGDLSYFKYLETHFYITMNITYKLYTI